MPAKPPPIPELVYQRVMLVGKVDGYMVFLSAGLLALFAATGGFWGVMLVSCLAAGTGAMEVHGARTLAQGDERGVNWLVRAQLLLMLVILGFVVYYLYNFNETFFSALIPEIRAKAAETYPRIGLENPYENISDSDMLMLMRISVNLMLMAIGFVTCLYQGLMARYYFRRREAVAKALDIMCE